MSSPAPKRQRANVRKHLISLIVEQEGKCSICQRSLPPDLSLIHVDHVVPISLMGTNDRRNLAAVHKKCNLVKGAKPSGCESPVGRRKHDDRDTPNVPLPIRDRTVKMRVPAALLDRWRHAAKIEGRSLSEYMREAVNDYADAIITAAP